MDPAGQVEVGADVVLHAIGDGMTVVGVQTAAVPPVAVEHQEGDAIGAVGQHPLGGDIKILLRAEAECGAEESAGGFGPRRAAFVKASASAGDASAAS